MFEVKGFFSVDVRWSFAACLLAEKRETWQSGEENRKRGSEWLDQIYQKNRSGTVKALEAHRDFGKALLANFTICLEPSSIYGLTASCCSFAFAEFVIFFKVGMLIRSFSTQRGYPQISRMGFISPIIVSSTGLTPSSSFCPAS